MLGPLRKLIARHFGSKSSSYRRKNDRRPVSAPVAIARQHLRNGQYELAIASFGAALDANPDDSAAYAGFGYLLAISGQPDNALTSYERALDLEPDDSETRFRYGDVLFRLGKHAEARTQFRQAIATDPKLINDRALVSASSYGDTLGTLIMAKRAVCDWVDFDEEERELLSAIRETEIHCRPNFVAFIASSAADQLACGRRRAQALDLPQPAGFAMSAPVPGSRLRIGYLSGDFHLHPTALLIAELFELHDRSGLEVFGYSMGIDDRSEIRRRLVKAFDRFVDLNGMTQSDIAKRIHADGINILVDLKGWMQPNALAALAMRPDPIQVTYLGFPGTTGLDCLDYVIADPLVVPPEHRAFFSETPVLMPASYQVNDRKRPVAAAPARKACGLPENGFVFCAFHAAFKITPTVFDVWMRLLAAVPGSILWLLEQSGGGDVAARFKTNILREALARGVDAARIVFAPRMGLADHLGRHKAADVFLDTVPVNAHTTMSDALWAGLPAITCVGDAFAGRVGASLLHAVGLPEFVAQTLPEYEALALSLARTPDHLAAACAMLARDPQALPLFDTPRFTRHLESAYRQMWAIYCRGARPETIVVEGS